MRAVLYESFGSVPRVENVPRPDPGEGGVLIQVLATGLHLSRGEARLTGLNVVLIVWAAATVWLATTW